MTRISKCELVSSSTVRTLVRLGLLTSGTDGGWIPTHEAKAYRRAVGMIPVPLSAYVYDKERDILSILAAMCVCKELTTREVAARLGVCRDTASSRLKWGKAVGLLALAPRKDGDASRKLRWVSTDAGRMLAHMTPAQLATALAGACR